MLSQSVPQPPTLGRLRSRRRLDHPAGPRALSPRLANDVPTLEGCFHSVQKLKYHGAIAVFCGI